MASSCFPEAGSSHRSSTSWLTALVLLTGTGCSVFGVESVKEAPYELVQKDEQFEIRDYAPQVVVETRVDADFKEAGNKAFRRLFDYISGENEASEEIAMTSPVIAKSQGDGAGEVRSGEDARESKGADSGDADSGEKIAMTAPVEFEKEGDAWRYQFVLPQGYSLETAPRPLNPDVTLAEIAPRRVATLRYSGRATLEAQNRNADVLIEWLESTDWEPQSEPRWAGYNAPWTLPPFRRNEVLIDVGDQ